MKKEKITVLEIKPMEHPRVCSIEPTIEALRQAVNTDIIEHGDIEAKRIGIKAYALFNKDRFLTGLTPNRQIGNDIICGTMYIVAIDEKRHVCSISSKQIEKYSLQFYDVEHFDDIDVAEANINTMMSRFWKNEEW